MEIEARNAADGVATFDVPRNVVAGWTGTAVLMQSTAYTGQAQFAG